MVLALAMLLLALALVVVAWGRRESAHAAARASEQRYRMLFNRSLAGVYQSTLDGKLVDCNAAFSTILGYESRESCLSHAAADLWTDLRDRAAFVARLKDHKT
ncbi:MAG: PAS domain S-box protein, partial [Vicinamibacterales bacterium]